MKYHLLFIALIGLLFTAVLNADLLYMVQSRSLFMSGSLFLTDCMRVPGGFLTWLGLWFTQFFYYPYLGGSLLVLMWLAIYVLLQRAFRPEASWSWLLLIPVVALIVSTVDLGYWIYILKQHGYWFRETLGVLFASLLLWLQGREDRPARSLSAIAIALAAYPLLGWYSVLALLCIIIRKIRLAISHQSGRILTAVALIASLIVPPLVAGCDSAIRKEEAYYAGFPVIESNMDFSWMLTLPFIVVALSMMALCLVPLQKPLHFAPKRPWLIHALALTFFTLIIFERNCGDRNYHAEMRMYRQVEDFHWSKVLEEITEAGEKGGSTRQMALCKDLALVNTQRIDRIFELSNGDVNRVVRDSCGAYMIYSAGPLLAMHHGMTNTAIRWTIESSVEYGLNVTWLKVLTLSALINGEAEVAEKYLSMLERNLFQSAWVRRYRPLAADLTRIDDFPELTMMRLLHDYPENDVTTDQGHVEGEVYKNFSNYINFRQLPVQELSVYYALREKNPTRFWAQLDFFLQQHPDQKVPVTFQEAAILFHQHDPNNTGGLTFNFPQELSRRFDAFNNYLNTHATPDMSDEEMGALTKEKFGKTYWWYYYFNRTTLY